VRQVWAGSAESWLHPCPALLFHRSKRLCTIIIRAQADLNGTPTVSTDAGAASTSTSGSGSSSAAAGSATATIKVPAGLDKKFNTVQSVEFIEQELCDIYEYSDEEVRRLLPLIAAQQPHACVRCMPKPCALHTLNSTLQLAASLPAPALWWHATGLPSQCHVPCTQQQKALGIQQ
jgi:hypothetical protein